MEEDFEARFDEISDNPEPQDRLEMLAELIDEIREEFEKVGRNNASRVLVGSLLDALKWAANEAGEIAVQKARAIASAPIQVTEITRFASGGGETLTEVTEPPSGWDSSKHKAPGNRF